MGVFASIKNFFSKGNKSSAKVAPAPEASAVAGPDKNVDSLQSKADASSQVTQVANMQNMADGASGGSVAGAGMGVAESLPPDSVEKNSEGAEGGKGEVSETTWQGPGDDGSGASPSKTGSTSKLTSAALGFVAPTTSDDVQDKAKDIATHDEIGITNDVLVGVQHVTKVVYSVIDAFQKKDWKSVLTSVDDIAAGLLAIEKKISVAGISEKMYPVIGGAISGLRELLNFSRVSDSLDVIDKLTYKLTAEEKKSGSKILSEDDRKVINSFKKEQEINLVKHGTQSLINFLSMTAPLWGPVGITVFPILQSIIPAVATIRDQWIKHVESTVNKARNRLGLEDSGDQQIEDLGMLKDDLAEKELTDEKFSLRKIVARYNIYKTSEKDLENWDKKDEDYPLAQQNVDDLKSEVKDLIDAYNTKMGKMTRGIFKKPFRPISEGTIEKIHDFHIQCIQNIMKEASEREQTLQKAASVMRLFMGSQQKQAILVQLYDGKVPEKTDIKLSEMTAEVQDYFWEKTKKEIGNAARNVQMSKGAIAAKMRKIMSQNKAVILKNMKGDGKLFQDEKNFDRDVMRVVNTMEF